MVITGGGTGLTYTPDANFTGTDTFTYTITDGAFATDTATVSITVTPVNDAPTAQDFAGTVAEDSTNIAVDLTTLTNDIDGDALTYTITTPLANGTLTPTGTPGIYTYTPNANFTGPDSFTYTVSDGTLSDTGTVSVTVTPVNDAPVAVDDTATVAEDSTANVINVLGNDSDPDGTTPTVTAVSNPTGGTVDLTGGVVTFTPTANYTGPAGFDYTLSDGTLTDTGHVTVTITAVNDPPNAVNDATSVPQDSTANVIDVLANDTDPDTGDTRTITAVTQPTNGTVVITGGGTGLTYTPNAGYVGPDTFTYTITDGAGLTDTATVLIAVTNVNDPPVAVDDTATVAEDSGANADRRAGQRHRPRHRRHPHHHRDHPGRQRHGGHHRRRHRADLHPQPPATWAPTPSPTPSPTPPAAPTPRRSPSP